MITSFDDYPIHSSSAPVNETASSDPNHYDRYFFNGYRTDASLYFGVALGLYPNRHVADASFSVILDGKEQISLHSSRRAPADRLHANEVGPIRIEIIEPLRRHRILVDSPEHRLSANLEFAARSEPVQEPHFLVKAGQRTVFDYTRLTQFGRWSGWIEIEGVRHTVDSSTTPGSRDRSWGVRPVGPAADLGAPVGERQFYWLWAPINFESFATHFDVNEFSDGSRWHETGFIIPDSLDHPSELDRGVIDCRHVDYDMTVRSGTRWAESFRVHLGESSNGQDSQTIELEPLYEFHMLGIGYGHPEWGHGHWKGDLAVGFERWPLPVATPCDPKHLHIQALCRARMGEHTGMGILEQLIIGPHEPLGLTGIIDPAP
ncbi:MAG: hypothetical protein ACKOI2_13070 [Actinomycetota bacterium]